MLLDLNDFENLAKKDNSFALIVIIIFDNSYMALVTEIMNFSMYI